MSITNYYEQQLLKGLKNESSAVAEVFCKLHVGDPGEEGTANPAAETTRKKITLGAISSPAGVGTVKTSAALEWVAVVGTETIKYVSLWDAVTAGNPLWSGALTAEKALSAGDTFKIPTEELIVTLD